MPTVAFILIIVVYVVITCLIDGGDAHGNPQDSFADWWWNQIKKK